MVAGVIALALLGSMVNSTTELVRLLRVPHAPTAVAQSAGVDAASDERTEPADASALVFSPMVEVETMTGAIDVQALGVAMDLTSISGAITVEGARGEVEIETVSGRVSAAGETVSSLRIETTTGPVEFRGSLAANGGIEIETFSSPVRLKLPKNARAVFDLQTFGGKIQSQFCSGTPVTRERFEPFRQLHCSTGPEEYEIRIRTHDADIVLEAQ